LAKTANAAGIGKIIAAEMPFLYRDDRPFGYYDVQVETAFVGCTNGQIIRVYRWRNSDDYMPVANSNFVFSVTTNDTWLGLPSVDWKVPHELLQGSYIWEEDYVPDDYKPIYLTKHSQRTLWYADDPEGQLWTQHLTNAIHFMRVDLNWTNYYELCRDGFSSTSQRIKEDVEWDLRWLIRSSPTGEHLDFMNNDPLFPELLKPDLEKEIEKRAQQ